MEFVRYLQQILVPVLAAMVVIGIIVWRQYKENEAKKNQNKKGE